MNRSKDLTFAAGTLLAASAALAAPVPDYNFDWATITAAGNAPYNGPVMGWDGMLGRGSVGYDYRIAKSEITSGQWAEFLNVFSARPDYQQFETMFGRRSFTLDRPLFSARPDPNYSGPGRWFTTIAEGVDYANQPVFNITWRDAAIYCNWLHNDKRTDMAALLSGAYDTSTWSVGRPYTDGLTHAPDAKFWIPTMDEWVKATFYDPNRYGDNQGGWWQYVHSSDTPPTAGLPNEPGATTSGTLQNFNEAFQIPLGAYVANGAVSPWGLYDTASAGSEWVEEPFYDDPERQRMTARGYIGTYAANPLLLEYATHVTGMGGIDPLSSQFTSVRIASSVPTPGVLIAFGGAGAMAVGVRRRR